MGFVTVNMNVLILAILVIAARLITTIIAVVVMVEMMIMMIVAAVIMTMMTAPAAARMTIIITISAVRQAVSLRGWRPDCMSGRHFFLLTRFGGSVYNVNHR